MYVSNSVQFLDKKKGKYFLEEQLFYHSDIALFQISLLLHWKGKFMKQQFYFDNLDVKQEITTTIIAK